MLRVNSSRAGGLSISTTRHSRDLRIGKLRCTPRSKTRRVVGLVLSSSAIHSPVRGSFTSHRYIAMRLYTASPKPLRRLALGALTLGKNCRAVVGEPQQVWCPRLSKDGP